MNESEMQHEMILVRDLYRRVTYKPGTIIEVFLVQGPSHQIYGVTVRISLLATNVNESGTHYENVRNRYHRTLMEETPVAMWRENVPFRITKTFLIPFELTKLPEDILVESLMNQIHDMETHEMHEWFKLDGVNVREPHPELKTQDSITE